MGAATTVATNWRLGVIARLAQGSIVTVPSNGLLSLACVNLDGECLTATKTTCLACNSPNVFILCLGSKCGLEHYLEDCLLMGGGAVL
jgi:hypothetical protein